MNTWMSKTVVMTSLLLTLNGRSSWAGPPNNDPSDNLGNTAGGTTALANNSTGDSNTAYGFQALLNNTTGSLNTASGAWALRSNTTGNANVAI